MKRSSMLRSSSKKTILKLSLIFAFSICSVSLFAQQKNLIGISGTAEWANGRGIRNISGITYERKFTNHFGIETGVQWHSLRHVTGFSPDATSSGYRHIFTNAPVLFKYYSNILNFSAGPTINIFTVRDKFGPNPLVAESIPKTVTVGYLCKTSKSINIKDKFVLEPEVNIGNRFEFKKPAVGIGASFKYKF